MRRVKKRMLCFFLIFAMIMGFLAPMAVPAKAAVDEVLALLKEPDRKTGVPSGYTAIRTREELAAVADDLSGNYILMNNIDLGGSNWEALAGTEPGNYDFTGVFEGNGYTIRNMEITKDRYSAAGLFEKNYGTIRNLRITGTVDLTSDGIVLFVGGIAVYNYGTIENCTSAVNVQTDGTMPVRTGGITYENHGTIDYCRYTGTMNATASGGCVDLGGITYINESEAVISHCENTGTMIARAGNSMDVDDEISQLANTNNLKIGGIAYNAAYQSKVIQCRNKAVLNISGSSYGGYWWIGGIVGVASAVELTDSCFNGSIRISVDVEDTSAAFAYIGGLCGDGSFCKVKNCYVSGSIVDSSPKIIDRPGWLFGSGASTEVSGCYYPSGTFDAVLYNPPSGTYTAISLTSMANQNSFSGYDFTSVWTMGQSYPVQKVFNSYYYPDGSGGETEDPDQITDQEYIAQHLAFAQSSDYGLRMDNRFAALLQEGMDTAGANAAEIAYDILNSVSELSQFKKLSVFENPYDAVLMELIMNSTEANLASVTVEMNLKLVDLVNNVWGMVKKVQPGYEMSEYKPAIQAFLTKPESLRESDPALYKKLQDAIGQYLDREGTESTLKALSGTTNLFGKIGEFADVVNTAGSVAEWVTDTVNYVGLVKAYHSMSEEYVNTLRRAASRISGSYGDSFRSALDKYDSWITEECIGAAVFKEGLYSFADLTLEVLSPLNQNLILSYMAGVLHIDVAVIAAPVAAYNFGWSLSDWITGNDKVVECRELIRANYYLEDALHQILDGDRDGFVEARSLETAKQFDASYMLLRNTEIYSLQVYKDYLEARQSAFVNGLLHLGNNNYNADEITIANFEIIKWDSALCHGAAVRDKFLSQLTVSSNASITVKDSSGKIVLEMEYGTVTSHGGEVVGACVGDLNLISFGGNGNYTVTVSDTGGEATDFTFMSWNEEGDTKVYESYGNLEADGESVCEVVIAQDGKSIPKVTVTEDGRVQEPDQVLDGKDGFVYVEELESDMAETELFSYEGTALLDVFVYPENATYQKLYWSSSDETVATVDQDGTVYGWETGTAYVTAAAVDGSGCSCTFKITVKRYCPYEDVAEGDWYYDYVLDMYECGIMTGLSDTVFGPSGKLCRAQFATILYRMDGEPDPYEYSVKRFPDVAYGQYFTNPVAWASSEEVGIVNGYSSTGMFGPADDITREQIAVMLYRYAGYCDYPTPERAALDAYPDYGRVSDFAGEAVSWAVAAGIISGDRGRLNPQGSANRAECAAMIQRYTEWSYGEDISE